MEPVNFGSLEYRGIFISLSPIWRLGQPQFQGSPISQKSSRSSSTCLISCCDDDEQEKNQVSAFLDILWFPHVFSFAKNSVI